MKTLALSRLTNTPITSPKQKKTTRLVPLKTKDMRGSSLRRSSRAETKTPQWSWIP